MNHKLTALAMGVLTAVVLTGCGQASTPKKVDNGAAAAPAANQGNKDQGAQDQKFKVGDIVNMDKINITVNSVKFTAGEGFIKAKEGKVYLLADVTVENTGTAAFNSSSLMMFKAQGADGYSYNIALYPDAKGSVDGEIGAGRKLRGEVAFEVPKDAKGLELLFEPNVLGKGQAIITLGDAK